MRNANKDAWVDIAPRVHINWLKKQQSMQIQQMQAPHDSHICPTERSLSLRSQHSQDQIALLRQQLADVIKQFEDQKRQSQISDLNN